MNALIQWSGHPVVHRLGWTLLHFLWQGAVIAGLFAVAQLGQRKHSSNARHLTSCMALMLMLAAPLTMFFALEPGQTIAATQPSRVGHPADVQASPPTALESTDSLTPEVHAPPAPLAPHLNPNPTLNLTPPSVPSVSAPWWNFQILHSETYLRAFVLVWLLGVSVLSLRLLFNSLQVARLKRHGQQPLGAPWLERLHRLQSALRLSRPVRLVQSALVEVPTVVGWLRPIILLPAATLTGLTPDQLESILAHELAHIRRHDYLVNLLQNALETLLFYHPAVWWISSCVRVEREICCDEIAIRLCGNRLVYAQALTTLEQLRVARPSLALGADGGSLLARIRRIVGAPANESIPNRRRTAGLLAVALVTTLLIALLHPASIKVKAAEVQVSTSTKIDRASSAVESARGPNSAVGLSLVIRCTTNAFKVGDEIPIEFVISNGATADYDYIDRDSDRSGRMQEYALTAQTESGDQVPDPRTSPWGAMGGLSQDGRLRPGQSFTRTIPLNHWALTKAPGKYQVNGIYTGQPYTDQPYKESWKLTKSAPITITILPRSEEEMDDYIRNLTNQIATLPPGPYYQEGWIGTTRELDELLKKLMYTCSPKIIPTLFKTMDQPGHGGFWEGEALTCYLPDSAEIRKAVIDEATQHGLKPTLAWVLPHFGFTKEAMKPLIERALALDHPGEWRVGAQLATESCYDDSFTPRLVAIALDSTVPADTRNATVAALARNRTEAGVRTLKTLLKNPAPEMRVQLAIALLNGFNTTVKSSTGRHLQPSDLEPKEVRPLIEQLLSTTSDAMWGVDLAEQFGDDELTHKMVALAKSRGFADRDRAIYALALNRTDEAVETLKKLLDGPDSRISDVTAQAIRHAYTERGSTQGRPLRPDDFDVKYQQPEATPAANSETPKPSPATNNLPSRPSPAAQPSSPVPTNGPSAIRGTVLLPNGQPAGGAQVGLSVLGFSSLLLDHRILSRPGQEGSLLVADQEGRFSFPFPEHATAIIAADQNGFARVGLKDFRNDPEITLQPWGRVEGVLRLGSQLGGSEHVYLVDSNELRFDWFSYRGNDEVTDRDGQFAFTDVPPGLYRLSHNGFGEWFTLKAGETTRVNFGGTGRAITGTLRIPPSVTNSDVLNGTFVITTDIEILGPNSRRWLARPNSSGPPHLDTEGRFRLDDVPAGTWSLVASVSRIRPGSTDGGIMGTAWRTVVIPEMPGGRSDEPLDLGTVDLVAVHSPQIGEPAPMFEIPTTDGGAFKLADHPGQCVVLVLENFKEVAREVQSVEEVWASFNTNGQLVVLILVPTFTGFGTFESGERKNLPQSQIRVAELPYYLGEPLYAAFGNSLVGVWPSTKLPAVFLLGPDGKIVAKDLHGLDAIEAAVTKALAANSTLDEATNKPSASVLQTNAPPSQTASSTPATNQSALSLVIRCTNDVIRVGDRIPIEFTVSNLGTNDFRYSDSTSDYAGWLEATFLISATSASGQSLPAPLVRMKDAQDPMTPRSLRPGESFTKIITSDSWSFLKEPGRYEVVGLYSSGSVPFRTNDMSYLKPIPLFASAPTTLTVLPRVETAEPIESAQGSPSTLGLTLTIGCTNNVFKVGDEIPIQFVISNAASFEYIYADRDGDRSGRMQEYELTARTESGGVVSDPRHGTPRGMFGGFSSKGNLLRGQTFSKTIPLNHWALLNASGKYIVNGTYLYWGHENDRSLKTISKPITITILPRSDQQMSDYISELTNQIPALRLIRDTNGAVIFTPGLEEILLKLMYTCSPKIVPTLMKTMDLPGDNGYWELEALDCYLPRSEEIRKAVLAGAAQRGLTPTMSSLLPQYGFSKAEIKPLIERALAEDNPGGWAAGAKLAENYDDDSFAARLLAIANTLGNGGRVPALSALAYHRTSEAVLALNSAVNDSDPQMLVQLATALLRGYGSSRNAEGMPLRRDGFTFQDLKPLIEKLLAQPNPGNYLSMSLIEQFADDATFTSRLIAVATDPESPGRSDAIHALALNRTEEGIKTLRSLLNDPDPGIARWTEDVIRIAYTDRGATHGQPLRPDDFDAKYQRPAPTPPN